MHHQNLSDLDVDLSRSLIFRSHVTRKGAELGNIFLLNTYKKSYIGNPFAPLDLALDHLGRSRSLDF